MKTIWNTFLGNMDQKYFGGHGTLMPMVEKTVGFDVVNPFAGYFR